MVEWLCIDNPVYTENPCIGILYALNKFPTMLWTTMNPLK